MFGRFSKTLLVTAACLAGAVGEPYPSSEQFHSIPKNPEEYQCYDSQGRAQRCIPAFENAAFSVQMEATNTCGDDGQPIEYCKQTGVQQKSCDICHQGDHPASFLTDHDNNDNATWWQSETMYESVQYPNQVNLTLHLGKTFDITYVRVLFQSPRPESWGIFKRKNEKSPWQPYQFYSATCRDTYGLPDSKETVRGDDTRVLCTSEYSDISPLTKGQVAFSTLVGRPSAYHFDTNSDLQEWVQATDLRITLDRLNTFGDEVFGDDRVLRSYYYAIADVAVGARCACNGHARECVASTSVDGTTRRVCHCEHNTAGPDCNECLPFYNDAPWGRAASNDAHECKPCNCNGYSDKCFFDKELYKETGHGGHCMDCSANRDGANCEHCRQNFYQHPDDGYCIPCDCDETGSRNLQCNSEGRCQCKPGVTGDKCDRCAMNFYNFGPLGCESCECEVAGSLENTPNCDTTTGVCQCKENVEGKRCRVCRPGFFNLAEGNEFGCTPCFCYGHSSLCQTAPGYSKVVIESMFARGIERWSASVGGNPLPLNYDALTQTVSVTAPDRENVYLIAPDRFLGDQRASYNQDLAFTLRIGEAGPAPTVYDVILEGGNGEQITQSIFGQRNPMPSERPQEYRFRLHEHPAYEWQPHLSSRAFMSVLSNLTAIKIRTTYTHQGQGFLDDVRLETAYRGATGEPADWLESCTCPTGYVGQFCESCGPKFHHDPPNGGPFASCVPCNCNGHAEICDDETGKCICEHNTAGNNCQLCARGFYGYPLKATPNDCKPCPCPDSGHCILLGNNPEPICSECPLGRTGPRCEVCSDGYFGNPERGQPCKPCECNNNIDLNAVRNCNQTTGECIKCVNNTAGFYCEECLPGYYGDALSDRKEDGCKLCQCYPQGTLELQDGNVAPCEPLTGHCKCKPHVIGRNCDKCEDGYFNIISGEGCTPCNCNSEGSFNRTCDAISGQCQCRPGITGSRCDACLPYQYGFSRDGCKLCECDIGSTDLQCDASGQCPCLVNVEGRRCDRCKENKFDRQHGCAKDCPPCYNLVQDAVNAHRSRLAELENTLKKINSSSTVIKDSDFENELKNVQVRVNDLLRTAKQASSGNEDKTSIQQLEDLRVQLGEIEEISSEVDSITLEANETTLESLKSITEAEVLLGNIHEQLNEAETTLATEGAIALAKARKRAEQVGQQNNQMTAIAQEARILATTQTKDAETLYELAEQARNTSLNAYNLAKKALYKNSNISDEIRILENQLQVIDEKLSEVKDLTHAAANKSKSVMAEALSKSISDLPDLTIDIAKLQKQAESISSEGTRIKEQAQLLLQDNEKLLSNVVSEVDNSKKLLERAREQQDATDDYLIKVDMSRTIATDAVKRANHTLVEAQTTLMKLGVFDAEVRSEQKLAQEALKKIREIEDLTEQALQKVNDADTILNGAEDNAVRARATAKNAQDNADEAGKNAKTIRMEANKTKSEALSLGNEADNLRVRVSGTETMIKVHESQAAKDTNITIAAKHKVGEAKANVSVAALQVNKGLTEVNEIMKELKDLREIDDADLDRLESRLNEAEKEIRAANLDTRIRDLTDAKNKQSQWIKNYEDEVSRLRVEVDNIGDIRKALPTDCFKRVILEP